MQKCKHCGKENGDLRHYCVSCKKSLFKDDETQKKVHKYDIGAGFKICLAATIILLSVLSETSLSDISHEIIGRHIARTIIPLIITFWCASKCATWAKLINKNQYIAYSIGFFLGFIGLLGYYLYYKRKIKNKNEPN